jgi:hypothetical protein
MAKLGELIRKIKAAVFQYLTAIPDKVIPYIICK